MSLVLAAGASSSVGVTIARPATASQDGGTFGVQLVVTPSAPVMNVTMNVTALEGGGTAPFAYNWSGLPPGCASENSPYEVCVPLDVGTFVIEVNVTDAANDTGSGALAVTISPLPPGQSSDGAPVPVGSSSTVSAIVWILVGIEIAIAVVGLILLFRSRRRERRRRG